jgi:hypothetical protein
MGTMTEWLKIMLGEVARKQEDAARAAAEQKARLPPQPDKSRSPAG